MCLDVTADIRAGLCLEDRQPRQIAQDIEGVQRGEGTAAVHIGPPEVSAGKDLTPTR